MRRALPFLLLAALGCAAPERPSFLLYVVDTLRADALGCYGGPATPNVDRLAAESIVYENAYAASSWTRPSMASLLTGLPPGEHGAEGRGDALPGALETLPAVLGDAGYRTAFLTANPNAGGAFGFGRGFDELIELYRRQDAGRVEGGELVASSAEVVRRAIEWIDASPDPFFLTVLDVGPHHPYTPPDATAEDAAAMAALRRALEEGTLAGDELAERVRALSARLYGGEVQALDAAFGRLLDHLRETGRAEDLLVVLTADHGEEFMEHGSVSHGHSLFEELLRVPWIVRPPAGSGVATPQRVQTPVSGVDLPGQALSLLGLSSRSIPAREPGAGPVLATLCVDGRQLVAIRDGAHKLLVDVPEKKAALYDLASDPGERTPLDDADRVRRLQRTLRQHLGPGWLTPRPCKDTFPDLPADVKHALDALGYGNG